MLIYFSTIRIHPNYTLPECFQYQILSKLVFFISHFLTYYTNKCFYVAEKTTETRRKNGKNTISSYSSFVIFVLYVDFWVTVAKMKTTTVTRSRFIVEYWRKFNSYLCTNFFSTFYLQQWPIRGAEYVRF